MPYNYAGFRIDHTLSPIMGFLIGPLCARRPGSVVGASSGRKHPQQARCALRAGMCVGHGRWRSFIAAYHYLIQIKNQSLRPLSSCMHAACSGDGDAGWLHLCTILLLFIILPQCESGTAILPLDEKRHDASQADDLRRA